MARSESGTERMLPEMRALLGAIDVSECARAGAADASDVALATPTRWRPSLRRRPH